jgi:hypothetical protein
LQRLFEKTRQRPGSLTRILGESHAIPEDITRLQVNLFKNPFREIAWLFTRVTGQENTASISRMILYILYFTVKEQAIFNWGKLISIEISSQLSQYKKDKKFFMSSYLVFTIAHCCQFPKLSICKKVNCEFDPVTFWYQALWRHKDSLHFYEVFNDFVSVFKGLSFEKFYGIIEYDENALDNWLVDYSVKNQDIEEILHGISIDLHDLEGELFNIKIRHEINVAPMKRYIEEWFKKAIDKLTNEGQEAVETVPVTIDENDKRTSTRENEHRSDHHSKFTLITFFFLYQVFHPVIPPLSLERFNRRLITPLFFLPGLVDLSTAHRLLSKRLFLVFIFFMVRGSPNPSL